jgi:predicted aldo/keto reductase-like oxidoreductase
MQYRVFGKTGINVSILGFGAMRLPAKPDGVCDYELSVPILRRAINLGINYFDSAYGYINGTSEVAVGKAIKGYERSKLYLATKIPSNDEAESKPDLWRRKLEECLKRFDTPYIDFVHLHGLQWNAYNNHISRPGWVMDEARKAQAEGLIRNISFSSHDNLENVLNLIDTGEFASLLLQYNYLDQHFDAAIAHAAEKGMGVAIMGPVAGGRLVTPQGVVMDSEGVLEMKTPELALRFVWNNPNVGLALSGMSTIEQLEENVTAAQRMGEMGDEERSRVQELFEKNQKLADLYCTGCSYCMPCPNAVNIPENFRYMNWFRVWGLEEEARKGYEGLTAEGRWTPWAGMISGLNADACLECGECEPKCPQNIHIIDQLNEVSRTLGK